MDADRIADFEWYPHPAVTHVLLKMDLIDRPDIDVGIFGVTTRFFVRPARAGRLGRSVGVVCAAGIPTGGTAVGTVLSGASRRAVSPESPTFTRKACCHRRQHAGIASLINKDAV